jgi:short-subunit dehydrogenase
MGSYALITGASAGLGAEFARRFARDKKDVVLVARRRERLESLASELVKEHSIRAEVIVGDLEQPDGPKKVFEEAERRGFEIEYLVNNAGFGTSGPFAESDLGREVAEMQVNMRALTQLTRFFLPGMLARKRGKILNIGSTAGFQPGPYMAVYYATKAYVASFSEALAYELRGSGVTVTLSCPGPTDTEFGQVARIEKKKLFNQFGRASAASVADEAYRAMMSGRRRVIHGLMNKLMALVTAFSPRAMVTAVAGSLNRE